MELNSSPPIQVFDPAQGFSVVERRLPHWSQAGTICFITWRTWDSIPSSVLQKWLAEQEEWLRRHNVGANLQAQSQPAKSREFQLFIAERWNVHLDDCHGAYFVVPNSQSW